MKYTLYIIYTLAALSLFLAGCDDGSPYMSSDWKLSVNSRYLGIDKSELSFGADQNLQQQLHVLSVATGWTLNGADAWITATPANGNSDAEVTLTATENKSGDDIRTTIMTFASAESDYSYSRPVSITQSRANAYINPDAQTLTFTRDASSQTLPISANTKWQATSSESWVSVAVAKEGNSLVVTVEENENTTERTAYITLKGNATTTILVKQSGSTFDDLAATLLFGNKAESRDVQVETDSKWTASTKSDWISLSPKSGSGPSKLHIAVNANPEESERTGLVTVKVGDTEKQIMVTQLGTYFTVNTVTTEAIPSTGGTHSISFVSSDNWSAESHSSWVTLVPPSGQPGASVVTIKAGDNASIHARYDTTLITIDNAYLPPYRIITRQEGRYLSVSTTEIIFNSDASTQTFSVMTDGVYEVTSEAKWLQCTKNGNTCKVSALDNPELTPRTATIIVRLTDVPESERTETEKIISVTQQGYNLSVDKDEISVGSASSSSSFTITSNDSWTVSSSVSWATVNTTSGSGNRTVSVSFSANTGPEACTGTITVSGSNTPPVSIALSQEGIGYDLSLDKSTISVGPATAAESFTITSNDTWTVTTTGAWATVSQSNGNGNKTITVNCQKNTSNAQRTCSINVEGQHCSVKTITITQDYYSLSTNRSKISVGASSISSSFTITSNDSWTVSSSVSWATVNTTSGSGNRTVSVSFSANTGPEARTGIITVSGSNTPAVTIALTQAGVGYHLQVDKNNISVGSAACTESITITSNDTWTLSTSASWVKLSSTSGSANKTINVEIERNTNTEEREATITVRGSKSGLTETVRVKQAKGGQNDITIDDFEDPIPLN